MLTIFLLEACFSAPQECPPCERELSCRQVALRDNDGQLDLCDLDACQTCVDSCGGQCALEDGSPPRYTCPGTSWNAHDFCPDWLLDHGPRATDVSEPTCGKDPGESLVASAVGPGRVEVEHVDFATGCCPERVAVDVAVEAPFVDVTYALLADVCDCACELDVTYVIEGLPAGEWTVVAGPAASTTTVEVP